MTKEKHPGGRPRLDEEALAMRINFTLPVGLVLRIRREIPDGQRSEIAARLFKNYLDEMANRPEGDNNVQG
jgi:hypothetical protein